LEDEKEKKQNDDCHSAGIVSQNKLFSLSK
jgi:hypothetical protein